MHISLNGKGSSNGFIMDGFLLFPFLFEKSTLLLKLLIFYLIFIFMFLLSTREL